MALTTDARVYSNAHQSMKQIEELGRLCYQNNIEKKDIFLMDQILSLIHI
mgnify:CR=1 FL=1